MLSLNSSGKAPIAMILIVILAVGAGAGAFAFLGKSKGKGEKKHHVEETQWKFEEFVVNLADLDNCRYLKVTIVLGVEGSTETKSKGHGGGGGGNPMDAIARDTMINVMSKKKYTELLTPKGKTLLKDDIKAAVNASLKDIKVKNVYFTSFAMQ